MRHSRLKFLDDLIARLKENVDDRDLVLQVVQLRNRLSRAWRSGDMTKIAQALEDLAALFLTVRK